MTQTIELMPTSGEYPIDKIDKYGVWFLYNGSSICIPHENIAINSCVSCRHFNSRNKESNSCKAFPDRIPDVIFLGDNDHKSSYPGDHGILYTPIK